MTFLKKAFITISSVPGFNLGVLICLMLLAFGMGITLACFDAATVRLFLEDAQEFFVAYDLLFASFLLFFWGALFRNLTRRKGYASVCVLGISLLLLASILYGVNKNPTLFLHILFISKYVIFPLFVTTLLLIVSRFIPLQLGSLKRVCIFGALFLGFAFGGLVSWILELGAYTVLYLSFILMSACWFSLFILTKFVPVEKEVFVAKTGEVKDLSELKLVRSIFLFCFLFFATKSICDYLFYTHLLEQKTALTIWKNILWWWGFLGLGGFLSVVILFRTRYFYMISGGVILYFLGVLGVVIGSAFHQFYLIFAGMIFTTLSLFLYFEDFVNALLRLLNQGLGKSINKRRWIFVEPAGFLMGALCCVHLPHLSGILFCFLMGLFLLLFLLLRFY